tara:strand:+ start:1930 stop:2394 length:465 start_codon:yes stop_codon:yes gene_type:complete
VQEPSQAAEAFDLPAHIVEAIADLSPRECEQLASGVMCSFVPLFSTVEMESIVTSNNTGELEISDGTNLNILERIYWELVARAANQDPLNASVRFGLSNETIRLLGHASPILIHDICSTLYVDFRLRFEPEIILEMQRASSVTALMKRAAAALG